MIFKNGEGGLWGQGGGSGKPLEPRLDPPLSGSVLCAIFNPLGLESPKLALKETVKT